MAARNSLSVSPTSAGIIAGSWFATPARRGEDLIAARESARLQQRQGMIKNIGTQGKG
jgi:hypothetical protein